MPHDLTYIRLKEALALEGCALCRLGESYGRKYLDWLLYERVNDMATRIRLAQSWGFCAHHAWLLQELEWARCQDGMGTAILWEWLVERYRSILQEYLKEPYVPEKRFFHRWLWRRRARPATPLLQAFAPKALCPACSSQQQSEEYALWVLTQHVAEEESFRTLYKESGGLCLPHFKAALDVTKEEPVVRFLVEVELETLARLAGELGEYLRKHDYLFSHEPYGSEVDAFIRATAVLVGRKSHLGEGK